MRFYNRIKESGKLKDFLVFLIFLFIAGFFWLLVVISDNANTDFRESIHNLLDSNPDTPPAPNDLEKAAEP